MDKYTEYSFVMPVDDIFKLKLSGRNQPTNLLIISSILDRLEIEVDFTMLKQRSQSYQMGTGDVFVFEQFHDEETFLYMDFYRGWMDQIHMVYLGVRCLTSRSEEIRVFMLSLYENAYLKSAFKESTTELLDKRDVKHFPRPLEPIEDWEDYVDELPEPYVQHIETWVNGTLKYKI